MPGVLLIDWELLRKCLGQAWCVLYTHEQVNQHAYYIIPYVCAKLRHDKQMNFSHVKMDVLKNLQTLSRVSLSFAQPVRRWELSYLAPLGSENVSAPYFKQCFFRGGCITPPDWVKHHASQSQDRNNKYFILYIEFCIDNKI